MDIPKQLTPEQRAHYERNYQQFGPLRAQKYLQACFDLRTETRSTLSRETAMKLIKKAGMLTVEQLADKAGCSETTAYRRLNELHQSGALVRSRRVFNQPCVFMPRFP